MKPRQIPINFFKDRPIAGFDASNDALRALLASGEYNPNSTDSSGQNLLHLATQYPEQMSCERITMLLMHQVDANAVAHNNVHSTPLRILIAHEGSNKPIHFINECRRLNIKLNFNLQDNLGMNYLILAAKMRNEKFAIFLLEQTTHTEFNIDLADNDGMTALHYACALGMPMLAAALILKNAKLEIENKKDKKPIDCTVYNKDEVSAIFRSTGITPSRDENAPCNDVSDNNGLKLTILSPQGPKLFDFGELPAVIATKKTVISLLRHPMIDNARMIVDLVKGHKPSWSELIASQEEKNKILAQFDNMTGKTCTQAALREQPTVRELLVKHGADYTWLLRVFSVNNENELKKLLALTKDTITQYINIPGMPSGKTALHQAAANNNENICTLLIDAKAQLNPQDENDNTPIMLAALAKARDVVTMLATRGADVAVKNKQQQTLFHILSSTGQHDLIQLVTDIVNKRSEQIVTPIFNSLRQ